MNKAEQRALEVYPKDIEEFIDVNGLKSVVDNNSWQRAIFLKGYNQAEKDLELTWEDIEKITDIWDDLHENEMVYSKTGYDTPEFYREVLKRFKDYKDEEV